MLKPRVEARNEQGVLVAEFWDCLRLDPNPVKTLRSVFEAHLRAGGRPELVVDLSGVGFAGSAALGMFVALRRFVQQKGGRIVFCQVDPTVFEVFRVSKLDPLFHFVADRASALELVHSSTEPGAISNGPPGPPSASETKTAPNPTPPASASPPPVRRRRQREG